MHRWARRVQIAKKSGDRRWYRFITDWRGSIRGVYDTDEAQFVQRIDYSPFGRELSDTNPGFQPFGFAGGLYDPDTERMLGRCKILYLRRLNDGANYNSR